MICSLYSQRRCLFAIFLVLTATLLITGTAFGEGEDPSIPMGESGMAGEAPPEDPVFEPTPPIVDPPPMEELAPLVQEPSIISAEEIPLEPDPYFTVGITTYTFTTTNCNPDVPGTPCPNPIQSAINYIKTSGLVPTDRKIYVESGAYTETVTLDGLLPNLGLMNGLIGVDSGAGFPNLTGNIAVSNVTTGFTLSGFNIIGGVTFSDVSGTLMLADLAVISSTNDGINISRQIGSVQLDRVKSNDNTGKGVYINNTAGNVTINNTSEHTFNGNGEHGLEILSVGLVTLNYVTAIDNESTGITIQTSGAVALTAINSQNNANNGLWVSSPNGLLTITNGVISNNGGWGMYSTSKGITLRHIVASNNYGATGLDIFLKGGGALLENVTASENACWGVLINPEPGFNTPVVLRNMTVNLNGYNGIHVATIGSVTVTNSQTNNNIQNGLYISTKGTVTLNTIMASSNGYCGLVVQGVYTQVFNASEGGMVNVSMASPTSIILTSPADPALANSFYDNGWQDSEDWGASGAFFISQFPVTISNFNSYDNWGDVDSYGYGVRVEGPSLYDSILGEHVVKRAGVVTMNTTIPGWRNSVSFNDTGVSIYSAGAVSINGLDSSENYFKAIEVDTLGAITLANVNDWRNAESDTILLDNSNTIGPVYMPVNISNLEVREALGDGSDTSLVVKSKGAITINNLFVENNNCELCIHLDNAISGQGRGAVTITNAAIQNNSGMGIQVWSNGAVLFTNVRVNNNLDNGAEIQNHGAPSPLSPAVTLTDCEFNDNEGTGLQVYSKGLVTLRGVEAQWNNLRYGTMDNGVTVYEYNEPTLESGGVDQWDFYYDSSSPVTITLRSDEFEPVVHLIDSNGATIAWNEKYDQDGVYTSVFYSASLIEHETYTVLVEYDDAVSNGLGRYSLSVNDDNQEDRYIYTPGMVINNSFGPSANVIMTATSKHPFNQFNSNNSYGLYILSNGMVSLTNLNAGGSHWDDGIHVATLGAVTIQSTITGQPAWLSENGASGVFVRARGAITLSNIQANSNDEFGADLDNASCDWDTATQSWINCAGSGGIMVKAISGIYNEFVNNWYSGLWAVSRGAITVTNVRANSNGWDGAFLWNDGRGTISNITVNTSGAVRNEFNGNALNRDYAPWFPDGDLPFEWMVESDYYWARYNGLTAMAGGAISILNSDVSWNQNDIGSGIVALNNQANFPRPVLISNTNAFGNFWSGLIVRSKGAITLATFTASDNGADGVNMENAYCYYNNALLKWVCPAPGDVTMRALTVKNNHGEGLVVNSLGALRLTGAVINSNSGNGAWLENGCTSKDGELEPVCPLTFNGITMSGVYADNNQGIGLGALSRGLITLTASQANNNRDGGFQLNNQYLSGATAGIILSGVNAHNNGDTGISVQTNGALTMANIRATGNARRVGRIWLDELGAGMTVQDFYNVDLEPDCWYFDADPGKEYKFTLRVDTADGLNRIDFDPWMELHHVDRETGEETLLNITGLLQCNYNDYCEFTFDPADPPFSYIDTESFFIRLGSNYGDGFYRLSLNDDASEPMMFWVSGLNFHAGGNVTMTGTNTFQNNSLAGIIGGGKGNISLANVGACNNGTEGIYLDNTGGAGNITMAGANTARDNGWEGLYVETNGTVNIANLDASFNGYHDEEYPRSIIIKANGEDKNVLLTNINAQLNSGTGLMLVTHGATIFNNVHAWQNRWDGTWINPNGYTINLINFCWFMYNTNFGFGYINAPLIFPTNTIFWANGGDNFGPDLPS